MLLLAVLVLDLLALRLRVVVDLAADLVPDALRVEAVLRLLAVDLLAPVLAAPDLALDVLRAVLERVDLAVLRLAVEALARLLVPESLARTDW